MIRLKEIAERINGELIGDGEIWISGISSLEEAKEGDITFLIHPTYFRYLKDCKASAIIVGKGVDIKTEGLKAKNIVISSNPAVAYAMVAGLFASKREIKEGVSPNAYVDEEANIEAGATIYPFVYIGKYTKISNGVVIYPFTHIGERCSIGEGSIIYPNVTIYDNVSIGRNVIIHSGTVIGSDGFGYVWDGNRHMKIPQLGTVEIEGDVEIGANVAIDRGSLGKTIIKRGTKIDNLVQVGHNVSIGENSIIVSQTGIAGSAKIGKNVVLAGQVGVRDHVNIGDNVKAGGQTGITKDVPEGALVSGTPHMPHREWLRMHGYLKNLPRFYERLKRLEETLGLEVKDD